MSGAEYKTKSAGDRKCCKINLLLTGPMMHWINQRLLQKNPSPVPWHLCRVVVNWWKTTATWVCGGKNKATQGSLHEPLAPLSTCHLCCLPSPPQWHSHSDEDHEKTPPHFRRKKRKQLSCAGKDNYYLLFKSGVTSGYRSMKRGNFQAERIWTFEILIQKLYLLVSYTLHRQTHPTMPGKLQKGPFNVAEQREAGGLEEA